MINIERERTFLIREIPTDINKYASEKLIDLYIPSKSEHAFLRLRQRGNQYEITKKLPINGNWSNLEEHTIQLNKEEFSALLKSDGDRIEKRRFYYHYKNYIAEIDIFEGPLSGLIFVDFEFKNDDDLKKFIMPDFCLADVTFEEWAAGGVLCSKVYEDMMHVLNKFNYKKIIFH